MVIDIQYAKGNNGMPDTETADLLNQFEDELTLALDANDYLNLGRRTYNDVRTIYFACKEFRIVSKNVHQLIGKYGPTINASYDIYKDKYWMTMNQYKTH